jgi:hypothetical protein
MTPLAGISGQCRDEAQPKCAPTISARQPERTQTYDDDVVRSIIVRRSVRYRTAQRQFTVRYRTLCVAGVGSASDSRSPWGASSVDTPSREVCTALNGLLVSTPNMMRSYVLRIIW